MTMETRLVLHPQKYGCGSKLKVQGYAGSFFDSTYQGAILVHFAESQPYAVAGAEWIIAQMFKTSTWNPSPRGFPKRACPKTARAEHVGRPTESLEDAASDGRTFKENSMRVSQVSPASLTSGNPEGPNQRNALNWRMPTSEQRRPDS